MSNRLHHALAASGIALLLAAALTGCATRSGGLGSDDDSDEPDDSAATELEVDSAWLDGGRMAGIVTTGSSTCIPTAEAGSYADGVLKVSMLDDPAASCTADLVPRVSLLALPAEVDPSQDLELDVDYGGVLGSTDLDGVAGLKSGGETDYQPSAGWTDQEGQFVLLTWGSSTCVPEIASVEATTATEVTVTFVTPPADQVCTMDMGPRAVVTSVTGIDEGTQAELVLAGSPELEGVRVPIYGTN